MVQFSLLKAICSSMINKLQNGLSRVADKIHAFFFSNFPLVSLGFVWKTENHLTQKHIRVPTTEKTENMFGFQSVIKNKEVNQDFYIKIERH